MATDVESGAASLDEALAAQITDALPALTQPAEGERVQVSEATLQVLGTGGVSHFTLTVKAKVDGQYVHVCGDSKDDHGAAVQMVVGRVLEKTGRAES